MDSQHGVGGGNNYMKEMTRRNFVKRAAAGAVLTPAAGILAGFTLPMTSTATAADKPTVPTFTVLNPRPDKASISVPGLAPRLARLDGKTVYILGLQNSLDQMLPYARALKAAVPTANVRFIYDVPTSPGEYVHVARPADEPAFTVLTLKEAQKDPKKASAAVVGNGH
jgi:hypothetical protein